MSPPPHTHTQSQQGTLPVPGAEQLGELGERMSGGALVRSVSQGSCRGPRATVQEHSAISVLAES